MKTGFRVYCPVIFLIKSAEYLPEISDVAIFVNIYFFFFIKLFSLLLMRGRQPDPAVCVHYSVKGNF